MSPASVLGQLRDAIRDGKDKIEKEKQKQAEIAKEEQKQAANDLNNGFSRLIRLRPSRKGALGVLIRVCASRRVVHPRSNFSTPLMYCLVYFRLHRCPVDGVQ
jgi:hypothetical protein